MKGAAKHDTQTLAANAVWNVCGFAVSVAIAFVMCPILIHGLGDQRYGIWSLVEAMVAYIALLDLGVGASVVRYVAKFEEVEDKEQLNEVFSTTLCIFGVAGGVAVAISAGLALLWHQPFGVPSELAVDTRWLFLLLGTNVAFGLIVSVFLAVLYGLGRFPARNLITTGTGLATAGLMFAVLVSGGGLVGLAIVILASTLAKGLIVAMVVRQYLPGLRFSPVFVNLETFRLIRGYSARAFVAMIAGRISFSSDAIVIGAFLAPQHITYFVVAARLTGYVKRAIHSVTTVLTPAISAREARGDQQAIRHAFLDGTRYILWIVLPIEVGLLILGKPFLSLWLDERFAKLSYPTLVILGIPLVILLSQSISARILYGMGRLNVFTATMVVAALFNISLSVGLVMPLGIEGVALGTAIPSACANVVIAWYMCRILRVPVLVYLRHAWGKPLLALPVAPLTWLVLMRFVSPTTWTSLVVIGSLGTFAHAGVAWLLEFRANTAILKGPLLRSRETPSLSLEPPSVSQEASPD